MVLEVLSRGTVEVSRGAKYGGFYGRDKVALDAWGDQGMVSMQYCSLTGH